MNTPNDTSMAVRLNVRFLPHLLSLRQIEMARLGKHDKKFPQEYQINLLDARF